MTTKTDDIDSLATCIEIQIEQTRQYLDECPDFTYGANVRQRANDRPSVTDVTELIDRERERYNNRN